MKIGRVWVVGSIVTLAVAWWLWKHDQEAAAVGVLVVSPFPCPPPFPC